MVWENPNKSKFNFLICAQDEEEEVPYEDIKNYLKDGSLPQRQETTTQDGQGKTIPEDKGKTTLDDQEKTSSDYQEKTNSEHQEKTSLEHEGKTTLEHRADNYCLLLENEDLYLGHMLSTATGSLPRKVLIGQEARRKAMQLAHAGKTISLVSFLCAVHVFWISKTLSQCTKVVSLC